VRRYETIFITHPDLPEEDLQKLTQRTTDVIQQQRGELLQVQQWGKKKLAYKIHNQWRGQYTLVDYAALSQAVRELERILRLDENVLKFLTVKVGDRIDLEAVRRSLEEAAKTRPPGEEEASEAYAARGAASAVEPPKAEEASMPAETEEAPEAP
jgi:small subunit ribosomal protein S6